MLKIECSHLSVAGIKFSLPQNFYIDIEDIEVIHPDGLRLISPEKDCFISFITTELEFESPIESLLDIFFDDVQKADITDKMFNINNTGYVWIEKPQMNEFNGLKYAFVKYHTKHCYYYEIHFDRVDGADRQLEIILEVPKKQTIGFETVLNRQNIKDFYESFMPAFSESSV